MAETDIQKRLEIINNLIVLGDLELVRVQVEKLKKMDLDGAVSDIADALDEHEFVLAGQLINEYLEKHIESPELPALRMQVQALEISLAEKQSVKVELERQIHHFYTSYQAELGEYILQVLDLRRQVKPGPGKSAGVFAENANKEYKSFKELYDTMEKEKVLVLTPERQNELRLAFLRASKLCHPDVVADEFKEQAEVTFVELKTAYEQSDMDRILDILKLLEQGAMAVKSSQITDLDKLKALVLSLKGRILALEKEIVHLKDSDTYRTLNGIKNWDQYFNTMRVSLMKEIQVLQVHAHG